MTSPVGAETDLGNGHWLRWVSWQPDRDLNPQYAGVPDIEKAVAIIRHELVSGDNQRNCTERGYCEAALYPDTPETRQILAPRELWQMISWEPLTLSPSILCHCGDHGFIREGRWVPA